MIEQYVAQFGKELELPAPLPKEDEGVYTLPIEEGRGVTISDTGIGYYLFIDVTKWPQKVSEDLLTELLEGQLMGRETDGAVLGLNEEGTMLTLSLSEENDTGYEKFRNHIEDFLNVIDFWKDRVDDEGSRTGIL
jgi:hypothetical protein